MDNVSNNCRVPIVNIDAFMEQDVPDNSTEEEVYCNVVHSLEMG